MIWVAALVFLEFDFGLGGFEELHGAGGDNQSDAAYLTPHHKGLAASIFRSQQDGQTRRVARLVLAFRAGGGHKDARICESDWRARCIRIG